MFYITNPKLFFVHYYVIDNFYTQLIFILMYIDNNINFRA